MGRVLCALPVKSYSSLPLLAPSTTVPSLQVSASERMKKKLPDPFSVLEAYTPVTLPM